MTALAGFWSFDGDDSARRCERMLKAQQVYGPESPAIRVEGPVAIGRRLFKLLPEDDFDRGPVIGPEGAALLVADIRIDNRDELRSALGLTSADARVESDAALLMKAWAKWGEGALDRLVGEFAFAIWEPGRQRLVLARDFLGMRPLHYHAGKNFFAFASMPKGLHALPEIPRAADPRAMAGFVALLPDTGSESYFTGIEKVRPGHLTIVTREGIVSRRYWEPARRELKLGQPEEYEEALREQLDRAVACRLRGADGHPAAHLSAGLDSSTVAVTAAAQLAATGGRVTAYTAVPRDGYEGGGLKNRLSDEGPLAAEVAALHPNIEHVRISSSARTPFEDLERYFHLYERPMLNLCNAVWSTAILDHAKARRTKVLLTGQAGNMSFSYDGMQLLPQLLREGRIGQLSLTISRLLRNGVRAGTVTAATIGPYLPAFLWKKIQRIRGKGRGITDYTSINQASVASVEQRAAELAVDPSYRPRSDAHETRLWVLNRVDFGNYTKGTLGGWGIDTRDPTGDRRLVEFCLSVPLEQFVAGGVPRSLARRAFADRLPASVTGQRLKGYQAPDWHEGLTAGRAQLAEELDRLAGDGLAAETLDLDKMKRLIEDWPSGGWHDNWVTERYRLALLRGTSAGHFIRKASGSNL
jgi:asparagine synthase (glutamine-hydrolysing)